MSGFRKAYSIVGALLMLEYFAQFFLIAATIFTIAEANDNAQSVYAAFKNADKFASLHFLNGVLVIGVTTLVLIALAALARLPGRTIGLTALLFVLLVVQFILGIIPVPLVNGLHGLNALILVGLAGALTGRNWAWRPGARVQSSAAGGQ
jgi:hypothetical protein